MTRVSLSRVHFPVTTLGPGRRVGVWFQGCTIRCPGCISVDTWDRAPGIPTSELIGRVMQWADEADGLTVSGGEPFDQPDALGELLVAWKEAEGGSVLIFTGHPLERVAPQLGAWPDLVDVLVTEPYRSDLPQTLALRGSDNQRMVVLTPRGAEFAGYERVAADDDLRLDAMFDEEGNAWLAGIPRRGDLARLRRLMAIQGHAAETSDRINQ